MEPRSLGTARSAFTPVQPLGGCGRLSFRQPPPEGRLSGVSASSQPPSPSGWKWHSAGDRQQQQQQQQRRQQQPELKLSLHESTSYDSPSADLGYVSLDHPSRDSNTSHRRFEFDEHTPVMSQGNVTSRERFVSQKSKTARERFALNEPMTSRERFPSHERVTSQFTLQEPPAPRNLFVHTPHDTTAPRQEPVLPCESFESLECHTSSETLTSLELPASLREPSSRTPSYVSQFSNQFSTLDSGLASARTSLGNDTSESVSLARHAVPGLHRPLLPIKRSVQRGQGGSCQRYNSQPATHNSLLLQIATNFGGPNQNGVNSNKKGVAVTDNNSIDVNYLNGFSMPSPKCGIHLNKNGAGSYKNGIAALQNGSHIKANDIGYISPTHMEISGKHFVFPGDIPCSTESSDNYNRHSLIKKTVENARNRLNGFYSPGRSPADKETIGLSGRSAGLIEGRVVDLTDGSPGGVGEDVVGPFPGRVVGGGVSGPSPCDSGMGDVEQLLREREEELRCLRDTMERNEQAILQVLEDKKRFWRSDLMEQSRVWRAQLEAQHANTARRELALQSHVVRLQQDNQRLRANAETLGVEKQRLSKRLKEMEAELERTRRLAMVETSRKDEDMMALIKGLSSFRFDGDVGGDRGKICDEFSGDVRLDGDGVKVGGCLGYELDTRGSKVYQPDVSSEQLKNGHSQSEPFKSFNFKCIHFHSDLSPNKNLPSENNSASRSTPKISNSLYNQLHCPPSTQDNSAGSLQRAVPTTPQMERLQRELSQCRAEFGAEQQRWLAEKDKVIKYQKHLQLNLVQILTKNGALEAELRQLTAEVDSARTSCGAVRLTGCIGTQQQESLC